MIEGIPSDVAKFRGLDLINSSTTPLTANATVDGQWVLNSDSVVGISVIASHDCSVTLSFSNDGIREIALPAIKVLAGSHYGDSFVKAGRYHKVKLTDLSGQNHTYTDKYVYTGDYRQLNSPAHFAVGQYAGSNITKPLDFNLLLAAGKFVNKTPTIKSGITGSISSGSNLTEDCNTIGGAYTGFPLTPQAAEIVVAGADTGTVYYSYMASATDTDYTFASKAITGAATYSLGHNIWRCNFAYFDAGAGTTVNAGNITIQSTAGPGTFKFCRIDAGASETQCAAYTVPYNSAIYLDMERGSMRGAASGQLNGYWWYRENGKSPRLRWPFEVQAGSFYFDEIDYMQKVPALTDIMPRITYSSANSQQVRFKYRLLKEKE